MSIMTEDEGGVRHSYPAEWGNSGILHVGAEDIKGCSHVSPRCVTLLELRGAAELTQDDFHPRRAGGVR
ncbi:hypothetical protein GCM10018790_00560 [Kitasatospora xanthocidica]|nr:hypothetical protein GCM10018790_00560 [Kitasatospora xanthocidica]